MNTCDVLIVGGGAAGLSAALVLSRARRSVVVVDAGDPRNAPAAHMHGFLSRDGFAPRDLLMLGRAEVEGYGGRIVRGTVTALRRTTNGLEADGAEGGAIAARRVLVATGLRDELPDIEGVRDRWGRDLLHCPYCHGYEVRDQPLAVLGGSSDAVQHALLIRQWSADVVLFSHTDEPAADQREQLRACGIDVVEGPVRRLVVEGDELTGIELESGEVVRRTAAFVRPSFRPNTGLLVDFGCSTGADGWVVTDALGRTSESNVWAAGNAVNPRAQVITAAGEGSATAIAMNNDLVSEDVQNAVRTFSQRSCT